MIFGVGLGESAEYHSYHEPGNNREYAEMLDEGLDILTGLWSGESLSYEGKHYQIEDVLYLPRPVQQPRIPIWVAGWWPNQKPMRRAARWDGVFPLQDTTDENGQMTPSELQECLAFIRSQQTAEKASQPYNLVHGGHSTYQDRSADAALVEEYAAIGVTWWLECPRKTDTLANMRQRIRLGPSGLK